MLRVLLGDPEAAAHNGWNLALLRLADHLDELLQLLRLLHLAIGRLRLQIPVQHPQVEVLLAEPVVEPAACVCVVVVFTVLLLFNVSLLWRDLSAEHPAPLVKLELKVWRLAELSASLL